MKATNILRDEHAGIERMLNIVEAAVRRLQRGEAVPPALFHDATEFFRNFADNCHHAKEEQQLFPALEERGVPREGGPLGVMLAEHDQGRAFIRGMQAAIQPAFAGDPQGRQALIEQAQGYIALLREHILKENHVLFPMADQLLSPSAQEKLCDAFEVIERERTGPGEHERYHRMMDAWERQVAAW